MTTQSGETLSSRLPGFYELPMRQRRGITREFANLNDEECDALGNHGAMTPSLIDVFIENAIGSYGLPLGVATNFCINDRDYLVPMAVEETSVLAAASHGAKLARAGGGFRASSSEPIMTGQIQLFLKNDRIPFDRILSQRSQELIAYANVGQERLIARGGGAQELSWRYIKEAQMLIVHLHVDTRDAMGANIVNTMCERVSSVIQELFPCEIGLRILTNLTDKRMARSACAIPPEAFATKEFAGELVVDRIHKAYQFAYYDVYRAATHNKGVMNGIDPVAIATGNDWRAVEAGAHAYASRMGQYRPMTRWNVRDDGWLLGEIELPMAVGTVGGVTKLHPGAKAALKILGEPSARELAEIMVSVGLAQNLSALRALATEGIQRGHMSLHQKNLSLLQRQGATRN